MNSGINFNTSYGDITIVNNDIQIIRNRDKIDIQAIINFFKTNEEDYSLTPYFGFNSDNYIGKAISEELASEISLQITEGLKELEVIVSNSDLEVLYLIKDHTIYYRLLFSDRNSLSFTFLKDEGFRLENEY